MNASITRRRFLQISAVVGATFPAILRAQPAESSPNNRMNVAIIGARGIGNLAVAAMRDENIVAFCDVDEPRADRTYRSMAERHPEE